MARTDSQNPYTPTVANDKGVELVQVVTNWYRANRVSLNSTQQTAVIAAITGILNGTYRV